MRSSKNHKLCQMVRVELEIILVEKLRYVYETTFVYYMKKKTQLEHS